MRKSKNIVEITYKGKEYLIRSAVHRAGGHVNFGSHSLLNVIVVNCDYPDKEAQVIDEQIYGFVPDDVIENYSDKDFRKYVNDYLD